MGSGSTFTTPPIYSDTTFYVQDSTCGGSSIRTAIGVYLIAIDTSVTVMEIL
ncbi:MAG: hypothetical protein IPI22_14900 [Bacteroidetes bacterium]|nr:hypothetical protein [Bacteroidota bacterium]